MTSPTTKAELLKTMRQAHADFSKLLKRIPEERMTEVALYDAWSIKDLIAHMVGWYRLNLDQRIPAARRGGTPRKFEEHEIDAFNAELFKQYHDIPLDEIKRLEAEGFAQLTQIIEQGEEDELFDVERYPLAGRSIASYAMRSTYGHYDEHLDDVRAWMRQNGFD